MCDVCLKAPGHHGRKRETLPLDDWVSPELHGLPEIIQVMTSGISAETGRRKTFTGFGKMKRSSLEIEGVKSQPRRHVIVLVEGVGDGTLSIRMSVWEEKGWVVDDG